MTILINNIANTVAGPERRFMRANTLAAAISLIALATQVQAMEFDTGSDLSVRWDNTLKYNAVDRLSPVDRQIIRGLQTGDDPGPNALAGGLADDADLGFGSDGIVSSRFDLLSEMDIIWKKNFGVRVSAAGWYDSEYGSKSSHPGYNDQLITYDKIVAADGSISFVPTTATPSGPGQHFDTWGALSVPPGEYTQKAEDLAYEGGELLDAFVFANFEVGGHAASLRLGRHTLYWGQSLFASGAIHGIAGSMAAIDQSKGLGVPGSEAKELFIPTNKFSGSLQITQDVSLVGYYSLEFEQTRMPALGTYMSPAEVFTDDSEFLTLQAGNLDLAPYSTGPFKTDAHYRKGLVKTDDKEPGSGEWGIGAVFNLADSGTEIGVYFLNYNDKLPQGISGVLDYGQFISANAPAALDTDPNCNPLTTTKPFGCLQGMFDPNVSYIPYDAYYDGANTAYGMGRYKWVYKEDNKLFGISVNKEVAGISVGMDLVYRHDVPVNANLTGQLLNLQNYSKLTGIGAVLQGVIDPRLVNLGFKQDPSCASPKPFTYVAGCPMVTYDYDGKDSGNYPGATGDTAHLVVNALGFLDPARFWDGGTYALEMTFASLVDYGDNKELLEYRIEKNRVQSTIAANFTPQWFQVWPSIDMKAPMSVSYGLYGENAPIAFGGNMGLGNGSVGLNFEYQQVWVVDVKYNFFFGSQDNGIGGNLKDRDNATLTIKRTF